MSVSRETLEGLSGRFGLPPAAAEKFVALLRALEDEPDPPTAIRGSDEAVDLHIADGLSGLEVDELATSGRIADVGAGAGFPGLALATALPAAHVDLIESTARKCEVITRLAAAAGLDNAHAVSARAEEWATGEGAGAYDAVTARALAPLSVLVEYAAPLLREGGILVAWKGARDGGEESGAAAAAQRLGMEPVEVRRVAPFEGARARHLHVFRKVAPTPEGFPRRPGAARKRPLG